MFFLVFWQTMLSQWNVLPKDPVTGETFDSVWIVMNKFDVDAEEAGGDYVKVYDGGTTSAALLQTWDSAENIANDYKVYDLEETEFIKSTGNSVVIQFATDTTGQADGFELLYKGVSCPLSVSGEKCGGSAQGSCVKGMCECTR